MRVQGKVISLSRGIYVVQMDTGSTISAKLSGKVRHNKINVYEGDRVMVDVSPYDLSNGLITFRYRPNQPNQPMEPLDEETE